jgi:hypothetical protein
MNNYIKAYPAIKNRVSVVGGYQFDQQLSQEQQTEHFISALGLSRKTFEGICLRRQQVLQLEEGNDEIELDL